MLKLSKNKALLLRLFYTNPEQDFYIQEIGRILGKKPGVFQKTLYAMESEGLLTSEYKANARFFRANADYPLYEEYKSVVFKTIGVVGSLKKILGKAGMIDFAFLYGSFAKNQESSVSDIDLILIGSPDENAIIRDFDELEKALKREINYKLYSLEEWQASVKKKDPFLLGIIKDQKIMVVGDEHGLRTTLEGPAHKKAKSGFGSDSKPITKGRERPQNGRIRNFY
jgi:predicted nucleotidyltransferase